MRNLGTRFNMSNVISLAGSNEKELSYALYILTRAMGINDPESLSPSEDRILCAFERWYVSYDDVDEVEFRRSPAYAYANLNTGVNLLFLMNNAYNPVQGLEVGLFSADDLRQASLQLHKEEFD